MTKRVALYARVSTENNGQDPRAQLDLLREYAARRQWMIIEEYVDEGVSGSKADRPALQRLMADARRRKFDVVAVLKVRSIRPVAAGSGQLARRVQVSWHRVRYAD